ncbi:MAG TPA: ABC transporter ATP-binding protein [Acidobacteriota bacterium]|nr:ABC transporter ATP-binding protein [Acidobacteriota bacterium]
MAIEIAHLTRKYGTLTAVEGLCLEVPRGRLFGFLGPNGAGKTTTIGCLTGQLDPSGGSICLFGERFTSASMDLKRRIGVMPEGLALFDQLYAHEFLSFIGRMYGLDKVTARRRVGELLDAMDLTSSLNRRLGDYSTGMRRKVAFAAAIIHAPEALFLDEPFAGMDVATVVMLKKWLRQFVARGRTVFLTTHVLETVERLCDDAAIINAGRLVWRGDVSNLSRGHSLQFDNRHFDTLEELFLHIVGQPLDQPDWF